MGRGWGQAGGELPWGGIWPWGLLRLQFRPVGAAGGGLSPGTGCELRVPECLPLTSPWGWEGLYSARLEGGAEAGVFVRSASMILDPVPSPSSLVHKCWWGAGFLGQQDMEGD